MSVKTDRIGKWTYGIGKFWLHIRNPHVKVSLWVQYQIWIFSSWSPYLGSKLGMGQKPKNGHFWKNYFFLIFCKNMIKLGPKTCRQTTKVRFGPYDTYLWPWLGSKNLQNWKNQFFGKIRFSAGRRLINICCYKKNIAQSSLY